MANVKHRVKAPKNTSNRKKNKNESLAGKNGVSENKLINKNKTKKLSKKVKKTKESSSNNSKVTVGNLGDISIEDDIKSKGDIVVRRPSDMTLPTTQEKVQLLLQNGPMLKGKLPVKSRGLYVPSKERLAKIEQKAKPKPQSTDVEQIISRSGHIKKKGKPNLQLLDDILKSELMIDDSKDKQKKAKSSKNSSNPLINNNSDNISNQNKEEIVDEKVQNVLDSSEKPKKKPRQDRRVTFSNGVMLTLALAPFKCDHCKKSFSSKTSIRRHMYMHIRGELHTCPYCAKKFRHKTHMKLHIKQVHGDVDFEADRLMCHICDKTFTSKENLELHLIVHTPEDHSYKCMYCDKRLDHLLLLKEHEKKHLVSGRYQCTVCGSSYDRRSGLASHVKCHLKIRDFICQYCGKDFLRLNSLRRHVQISHSGRRIQCPICNKKLKGHLTEHMRTHEKRRPHKCLDCGQSFTQSTQLNVHRRSHTGVRPYSCRICNRRFTHSNAHKLHIRRHTGEKPFQCPLCPIMFAQLPHMKSHMQKIHGQDNPYKCYKCNQFFKLKVDIEKHRKSCKVGEKKSTSVNDTKGSEPSENNEMDSAMSLPRMRFLLALLFSLIVSKEKLKFLGFNKRLIDDQLVDSLQAMGQNPLTDENVTPLKRLNHNIQLLLNHTVPKEQIAKFQKENKTLEELLEILTGDKKKNT